MVLLYNHFIICASGVLAVLLVASITGVNSAFVDKLQSSHGRQPRESAFPPDDRKIDCIPEAIGNAGKATEEVCRSRGCVYMKSNASKVPDCFFDRRYGYRLVNQTDTNMGKTLFLVRRGPFPFPDGIKYLRFEIQQWSNDLLRIKITDRQAERFTVPVAKDMPSNLPTDNLLYEVKVTREFPFQFQVIRKSTGTVLFNTEVGGLVLCTQFLQIATLLPSANIYGFGENQHHSFSHDLNFTSWPLFGRDQPPAGERNSSLYGYHPFYTVVEDDGNSHGVFIFNSHAQEYSFTPAPMLTYRTIGGILDLMFFLGPEPETVIQQYQFVSGLNLSLGDDFRLYRSDHMNAVTKRKTVRVSAAERIDCIPDYSKHNGQLEQECGRRQCIWKPIEGNYVDPACYTDNTKYGYRLTNVVQIKENTQRFKLQRRSTASMFGDDSDVIHMDFEQWSDTTFRIKFHDPSNPYRYEVPVVLDRPTTPVKQPLYRLKYGTTSQGFFYFKVIRKSTKTVLWDTSLGGFIFSEQFLQIATKLPSSDIYGFGENDHITFRHDMRYKEWPMFTRDAFPGEHTYQNLYGMHPFYTCMEDEIGNSHGVLLLNSNAQEYALRPVPSLTYRTTGGILDFYFFLGPEPGTVVQQYTEVIGRPYMPPYWALGFQLCRYGYNSLDHMKTVHDRMVAAKIPYDTQYADIDYMDERRDFTYDRVNFAGLPEFVKSLHAEGKRFIPILDPALVSNYTGYRAYDLGRQNDIFIKWPAGTSPDHADHNNDDMLGYVWPKGKVVFPDFLNPKAKHVWTQLITELHSTLEFDGLWIDMNEPSNFATNQERSFNWPVDDKPYWTLKCPQSKWDDPPYKPRAVKGDRLSEKTLCMVGLQNDGAKEYRHYDVHSLYGYSEMVATSAAVRKVTGKRGVVVSRSTFVGSGRHGYHWLGDNKALWSHMQDSIIGVLEFNLFGIPYVGADICGFIMESTAELCQRWMQLGAFYPLSRNHNNVGEKDQDPTAFGPEVAASSRKALETRYELLPYLYTLFYRAHTDGSTVVRPVMHEYPHDAHARGVQTQFLWGPAFLVAPVIEKGKTTKDVYFPADVWYDYATGNRMEETGKIRTVSAPRDVIPLYVRGGYVLPTQQPATTTQARLKPMGLVIAADAAGFAQGELYLDDGESYNATEDGKYWLIKFVFQKNVLSVYTEHSFGFFNLPLMDNVRILGLSQAPATIHKDSELVPTQDYKYYSASNVLTISRLGRTYAANFTITIS